MTNLEFAKRIADFCDTLNLLYVEEMSSALEAEKRGAITAAASASAS